MAVNEIRDAPQEFIDVGADPAAPAAGRTTLFTKAGRLWQRASGGAAKKLLEEPYSILVPGVGAGTVDIAHDRNRLEVIVTVQHMTAGVADGSVGLRWWPIDVNTVRLDFDTYVRVANEFKVTIA